MKKKVKAHTIKYLVSLICYRNVTFALIFISL